jgi:hypothetical protein
MELLSLSYLSLPFLLFIPPTTVSSEILDQIFSHSVLEVWSWIHCSLTRLPGRHYLLSFPALVSANTILAYHSRPPLAPFSPLCISTLGEPHSRVLFSTSPTHNLYLTTLLNTTNSILLGQCSSLRALTALPPQ